MRAITARSLPSPHRFFIALIYCTTACEEMLFCLLNRLLFCCSCCRRRHRCLNSLVSRFPSCPHLQNLEVHINSFLLYNVPRPLHIKAIEVQCIIYCCSETMPFAYLTGFLHGIVQSLMEKVKIKGTIYPATHTGRQSCIPTFEAGGMAFIVVAMKLCYGIDDKAER